MARELHLIWMIFCVHLIGFSSQQETGFIYKRFGETGHGVAKGLLKLTDGSRVKMGHTFFKNPCIRFTDNHNVFGSWSSYCLSGKEMV